MRTIYDRIREWYASRVVSLDCADGRNCAACEGCDCEEGEHAPGTHGGEG